MDLQEVFGLLENKPVAFLIKGSPDPDAIACALALSSFYDSVGGESTIYYESSISHPANKTMINILDIKMKEMNLNEIIEPYYAICDHCDPFIESESKCILHIDHHKIEGPEKEIDFEQLVEYDAGSCSAIVTRLLDEADYFASSPNVTQVATALAYGIKSDTDNLDGARSKDWDAMKILSQYYNKETLQKITSTKISTQTAAVLKTALAEEKTEQNWLYAGVGFLQETYRDSIAQVADEMMRRQGVDNVMVYAIIEKSDGPVVQGSVRSVDDSFDMESFVKSFSNTSAGGRKYKGGFEIPLGFWGRSSDKEMIEDFVKKTMEECVTSILTTTTTKKKKKDKEE